MVLRAVSVIVPETTTSEVLDAFVITLIVELPVPAMPAFMLRSVTLMVFNEILLMSFRLATLAVASTIEKSFKALSVMLLTPALKMLTALPLALLIAVPLCWVISPPVEVKRDT